MMMVETRVFHWSRLIPLNPFAWWRGSSSPIEIPLVSQIASHSVFVERALGGGRWEVGRWEVVRWEVRRVRRAITRRRVW